MVNRASDVCETVTDVLCGVCPKNDNCVADDDLDEAEFHDILIQCIYDKIPIALRCQKTVERGRQRVDL
jgi:hypothetical protein